MLPISPVGGYRYPLHVPRYHAPSAPLSVPCRRAYDPLESLSTSLSPRIALHQRYVFNQCGIGNQHVGALFIFAQYAAKAATLAMAMPALWLSADYASLVEYKRYLRDGGLVAGGVDLYGLYQPPERLPLPQLDVMA